MILIQLNKDDFEYDIHSLVKAFYPSENISVWTPQKNKKKEIQPISLWLDIEYRQQEIFMLLKAEHASSVWEIAGQAAFPVDFCDRKQTKNLLKQNLYHLLSAHTGQTLPWGTLTGIRPTKIAMNMLESGTPENEIAAYMAHTYETSKEKIDLSIAIAQRELTLLRKLDYVNGYSLYIGIPFCPSTCLYCSFPSYSLKQWADRVDDYLDALEQELSFTAAQFADKHLNCIYIGGGTPTTLTPKQLDRLFSKIESIFDFSNLLEYTVEAGRPDSITKEKLEVLRAHGISRISINPQTMKQKTLTLIGRQHTVEQTVSCFYLARELGFDNINMDLIMGLPEETLEDVQNTMESLRKLDPDNLTIHSLAIKRAARLHMFSEVYAGYKMVNTQAHLDTAASVCRQMGMFPYYLYRQKNMAGNFENIGYAKNGKEGIYNILIMEEKQSIVALGAGSISKHVSLDKQIKRCENVKDVALYIDHIDEMMERKRKLFASNHSC